MKWEWNQVKPFVLFHFVNKIQSHFYFFVSFQHVTYYLLLSLFFTIEKLCMFPILTHDNEQILDSTILESSLSTCFTAFFCGVGLEWNQSDVTIWHFMRVQVQRIKKYVLCSPKQGKEEIWFPIPNSNYWTKDWNLNSEYKVHTDRSKILFILFGPLTHLPCYNVISNSYKCTLVLSLEWKLQIETWHGSIKYKLEEYAKVYCDYLIGLICIQRFL